VWWERREQKRVPLTDVAAAGA